ncbi:MAG: response regulator [Candidatus Sulfotelmatobacter sp.]
MKNILVVDNNEILCCLACDILRTEGYRAVPASNAAEALHAFEEQDFDLLVTAFQMPGMTGIDLARAVRSRNPDFPVIVMTAFEPVECEHVTLWLPKEYLFPNLLEKIRDCLAGAKQELQHKE